MTMQDKQVPGAPCRVDSWQPDLHAATRFYGGLLGWRFDEPVVVTETGGEYRAARLGGRRVAGIGQAPPGAPAVWTMSVGVERLEPVMAQVSESGGGCLAGPLSLGSDGRLAVVADPAGVAFGLWEAGSRGGAEVTGQPGAWAMSSLHTTDLELADAFYGGLFGWELRAHEGIPFSEWRLGGEVVAVASPTDGTAVPAHWSVNIEVGDVDAVCRRAEELGGGVPMAPFDALGMRNAVVADPQGAVLALSGPIR